MARGCAYSYNCNLTTSSSIFLPAMPQWLQSSEHLFHSQVIAASGKKKNSNRPTCPSKDTLSWTLIPSCTSKWQELQRGKKKKMWLEQISSMKASAQEEFYLHQRLPKPTWHFFFRAGRRAGRYSHLGFPQLVPVARASARSSGAVSHAPVLCIECVNQSLNILYSFKAYLKVSKTT